MNLTKGSAQGENGGKKNVMGVFIIWSGENSSSHKLAKALHQGIPNVVQHANCYVSSEDIYPLVAEQRRIIAFAE
jgi:hypothetical protein